MNEAELNILQTRIHAAQRMLVVSHIHPDGDAIGSLLALGLSLQSAGKDVQMVLSEGVPSTYRSLPGSEQVRKKPEGPFDLTCTVDCSDLERVGKALNGFLPPDVNIDHHPTNVLFARHNFVEPEAAATTEILADLIPRLGLPVTQPVATALLTGIVTDTLGFRTFSVSPKVLRIAADLMETGASLPELYHQTLLNRSFVAAQYWGRGLSKLQREGRLVWTSLSLADREAVGYPGRDDADLINVLTTLNETDVVILFVEQVGGKVKVSWRAQPGFDVGKVAFEFGGGGHLAASGAEIDGTLEEVQAKVLESTRRLLQPTEP
jgi:phosphoesterase RecJ-like protein